MWLLVCHSVGLARRPWIGKLGIPISVSVYAKSQWLHRVAERVRPWHPGFPAANVLRQDCIVVYITKKLAIECYTYATGGGGGGGG